MKLFRNALASGLLAGAMVVACSSHHGSDGTATNNTNGNGVGSNNGISGQEGTGSVGMHLTIGPGLNLYALNWTITNGTNSYSGSVQIGDAQSIEFVAGGILAGGGYTVTLTGTDSAGDFCQGASTTFTVAASATSFTGVVITCTQDTDATSAADVVTGSVHVDAGVVVVGQPARQCPGISSFSISPAEILATGQTAQLNVATVGPAPTSIQWTVSGGSGGNFSSPTAANPVFSCGGAGLVTVTVQVLENGTHPDGTDAGNVCNGVANTSFSGTINCEATGGCPTCFAPTTLQCGTCADGGPSSCVNPNTDNNNCGGCGIVCASPNTCVSGVCKAPPPASCTGFSGGANTPAGCIPCKGSPNGVCTPTEKIALDFDINKNGFTSASPTTKAASCYYCMVASACLDSVAKLSVPGVTTQGKSGIECEDPNSATNVASTNPANCRDALTCTITSSHCSTPAGAGLTTDPNSSVSDCFCGTHLGAACTQPPPSGGPNGPCVTNEDTDLGSTDPTTDLAKFTDGSQSPGGVGNQILNCALTANCAMCFQ
jgi:hypothetical protein